MPTDPTPAQVTDAIVSALRMDSEIDGGALVDNDDWWFLGAEEIAGGVRLDFTNVANPTDATRDTIRSFLIAAIPVDAPDDDPEDP